MTLLAVHLQHLDRFVYLSPLAAEEESSYPHVESTYRLDEASLPPSIMFCCLFAHEIFIHHVYHKTLLKIAAEPLERTGTTSGDDSGNTDGSNGETIRILSEQAVDVAVMKMGVGGPGSGSDGDGGGGGDGAVGCVSEKALRKEVDLAIGNLMADGTGLRDYANAAVGGKVVR